MRRSPRDPHDSVAAMLGGVILGCWFVLLAGPGIAATIYVDSCAEGPGNGSSGDPYPTLTDALAAAGPGDHVVIRCGRYPEVLPITQEVTIASTGGPALIGAPPDHLWAGANNADIFDEPDEAEDPAKTLNAMLDRMAAADLRVLRIWIDYRLELGDDGMALPVGQYNDCILEAIDHLMVEVRLRGILLLVAFQAWNWLTDPYLMSVDHYSWRRCKTPADLYEIEASNPEWEGGEYPSPYQQRTAQLGWGNFFSDEGAKDAYRRRVSHILEHRNPFLDNRRWKDINEVIWAWELFNEPEHRADLDVLIPWLHEMGTYVKQSDPNTYLSLGTKIDEGPHLALLDEHFEAVDIYTMHAIGSPVLEAYIEEFNGPEGVGGRYGKLLLLEEFTPKRGGSGQYDLSAFESYIEAAERVNSPWMWWEYGYKFDDDDVWHSGLDEALWSQLIAPRAATAWNTPQVCGCRWWRVGDMVEDLLTP